jgi:glucokinase
MTASREVSHHVGIDLGGTNMSMAVVNENNCVISCRRSRTQKELGPEGILKKVSENVFAVIREAGLEIDDILAIGIGVPSPVIIQTGVALNAPNLGWRHVDVRTSLESLFGVPVWVDNDVNVAVYGEVKAGAARGFSDVLGIWNGTGVGGGLVLRGELYYGYHGTAGEIGHTIVLPGEGSNKETLEEVASRTAIVETLVELMQEGHHSIIEELVDGSLSVIKSKTLAKAAKSGDDLTVRVLRDAARFVGIVAANCVTTLSLSCVVLGGGLPTELGDLWTDWVSQSVLEHVFPEELKTVKVVGAELGDNAGVIGAAIIARECARGIHS